VTATEPVVLLALGNAICGDDGIGAAALEGLLERAPLPPGVRALDGGTLGRALLAHLEGVSRLVLVDAVRADAAPGTLVRLDGEDVEAAARERLSVHQVGVVDLLQAMRLLDAYPREVVLLGLVPETVAPGVGLSAAARRGLPRLVDAVADELARVTARPPEPAGTR
jgi:hydrogenase maturation protease